MVEVARVTLVDEEKLECVDYKNRVSLGGETDIGVTATIAVGLSSRHPMSYRK